MGARVNVGALRKMKPRRGGHFRLLALAALLAAFAPPCFSSIWGKLEPNRLAAPSVIRRAQDASVAAELLFATTAAAADGESAAIITTSKKVRPNGIRGETAVATFKRFVRSLQSRKPAQQEVNISAHMVNDSWRGQLTWNSHIFGGAPEKSKKKAVQSAAKAAFDEISNSLQVALTTKQSQALAAPGKGGAKKKEPKKKGKGKKKKLKELASFDPPLFEGVPKTDTFDASIFSITRAQLNLHIEVGGKTTRATLYRSDIPEDAVKDLSVGKEVKVRLKHASATSGKVVMTMLDQTYKSAADFEVGDSVSGYVQDSLWRGNALIGLFVNIGAETSGFVRSTEISDTWASDEDWKSLQKSVRKLGADRTMRVFYVTKIVDEKIYLTMRQGDLPRPSYKMGRYVQFRDHPEWLKGTIAAVKNPREVLLSVTPPSGNDEDVLVHLPRSQIPEKHISDMVVGQEVRIRLYPEGISGQRRKSPVVVTMKEDGRLLRA